MPNEQKDPQAEKDPNQIGLWLSIEAGSGILPLQNPVASCSVNANRSTTTSINYINQK